MPARDSRRNNKLARILWKWPIYDLSGQEMVWSEWNMKWNETHWTRPVRCIDIFTLFHLFPNTALTSSSWGVIRKVLVCSVTRVHVFHSTTGRPASRDRHIGWKPPRYITTLPLLCYDMCRRHGKQNNTTHINPSLWFVRRNFTFARCAVLNYNCFRDNKQVNEWHMRNTWLWRRRLFHSLGFYVYRNKALRYRVGHKKRSR